MRLVEEATPENDVRYQWDGTNVMPADLAFCSPHKAAL